MALVPIIGIEVKGAKRWLNFYFFNFQPIEILKPFFILMTVKIITFEKLNNFKLKYLLSFLLLASVLIKEIVNIIEMARNVKIKCLRKKK